MAAEPAANNAIVSITKARGPPIADVFDHDRESVPVVRSPVWDQDP